MTLCGKRAVARCNYFPNRLFVRAGIEIHACQISMGLDWMPSGGQSSSSSSRVVVVVVVVVDEVVLLLLVVVVVVVAVAVVGKAAAVVCGSDPSTLVRASSNV